LRFEVGALCLTILGGFSAFACGSTKPRSEAAPGVELHFFDVGKGDAVLIRSPDGRSVLYDGGRGDRPLLPLLGRAGVKSLELVIASHNHSDHVGGLAEVIRHYRPLYVMDNGLPLTTRRYERFVSAAAEAGATLLEPSPRTLDIGGMRLHVLPPPGILEWGQNDNSIGIVVELGEFRASLLGDSEPAQQDWWLKNHGNSLGQVTVHKGSHHGSRKGDTPAMMRRLRPSVVVVGVERGGRYPHAEVVGLYRSIGATLYRTGYDGTIVITGDQTGAFTVAVRQVGAPFKVAPDPAQSETHTR
jgi:competence protein ComEC